MQLMEDKILTEGKAVADTITSFVLQPQSEIQRVRRYLNEHGYRIVREDMVEEDGKYYPMMRVVHGEAEEYTACEYLYGRCLLREKHPVLEKFLKREQQIKESVFCQLMKHKNSESAFQRMEELRKEMELVKEALAYYELQTDEKE